MGLQTILVWIPGRFQGEKTRSRTPRGPTPEAWPPPRTPSSGDPFPGKGSGSEGSELGRGPHAAAEAQRRQSCGPQGALGARAEAGEGARSRQRVPGPRLRDLAGDLHRQSGSPSPVRPSGLGTSHTSSSLLCIRGEKAGSLWRAEGDPDQQTTASSRRSTRGQLPSGRGLLHLARCRPRPGPERCRRPALAEGSAAAPRMVWGAQLVALFAHQAQPCLCTVGRPGGRVRDVGRDVPEQWPARQASEGPGASRLRLCDGPFPARGRVATRARGPPRGGAGDPGSSRCPRDTGPATSKVQPTSPGLKL